MATGVMVHSKIHIIRPGCIALTVQNRGLRHQSFHLICLSVYLTIWLFALRCSSPITQKPAVGFA